MPSGPTFARLRPSRSGRAEAGRRHALSPRARRRRARARRARQGRAHRPRRWAEPQSHRGRPPGMSGPRHPLKRTSGLRTPARIRSLHHPRRRESRGARRALAGRRGRRPRPRHLPGPPVPARVPRHVDAHDLRRGADRQHPHRTERARTCRCVRRPSSRARRRASTCSRAALRPRASAPAGSGTRSRRWAAAASHPGQAVTALEEAIDVIRELWDTSERRGASPTAASTGCTARSGDRVRPTTSRSGSARTSRACSPSPAARATAGCPRSDT